MSVVVLFQNIKLHSFVSQQTFIQEPLFAPQISLTFSDGSSRICYEIGIGINSQREIIRI